MPQPLGRDRLEPEAADGTLALLSLRAKSWVPREDGAVVRPGTAVRWEGELYEVIEAEEREAGGFRYVLAPWDERQLVRAVVEYGAPEEEKEVPQPRARVPEPWRALALGFVPAVLLGWFLPFRILGEGFSFLVHELGHTAVGWLFGCTAIPAVVLTIAFEQVKAAAALIWVLLAGAAWYFRKLPRWNGLLVAAAALYPLVAFTPAYLTAFDLGGHLAELAVSAWALRRAISDERPEWERPVWSFFAFYLVWRNAHLFLGVAASSSARTDYLTIAIAGRNDLVKVAETLGVRLEAVAALTALAFLVLPAAAALPLLRLKARPEAARLSSKRK